MISEGFVRECTYRKAYQAQSELRTAQKDAQKNRRGMWGSCG